MDREFMREYYREKYLSACQSVIGYTDELNEKREIRNLIEAELTKLMGGTETALYQKFDEFITALEDEKGIIQEEFYLLGAEDREKMLR